VFLFFGNTVLHRYILLILIFDAQWSHYWKIEWNGKSFHHVVAFYSICSTTILVPTKLREYRNLHKQKNYTVNGVVCQSNIYFWCLHGKPLSTKIMFVPLSWMTCLYLMILSKTQILWHLMIESPMTEFKRTWNEVDAVYFVVKSLHLPGGTKRYKK